jgi:hypothetical protein
MGGHLWRRTLCQERQWREFSSGPQHEMPILRRTQSRPNRAQRNRVIRTEAFLVIRVGTAMADAKPSDQHREEAPAYAKSRPQADELELLREETKRLRGLVVQLSKVAIRNAVDAK